MLLRPDDSMSFDKLEDRLGYTRVPSISRSRSGAGMAIVDLALAAIVSLWPRQSHPPNVPDYLRADLGLPPDYDVKTFHDITLSTTLRRRVDHE
jgi:hypothetical protein